MTDTERREKCIKPRAGDADLRIKIWEELHSLSARKFAVGVEHDKAHRTKKEKKHMTQFERFVAEGQYWNKGFMAEARAETMQREREEVFAALQYAASFHFLVEEWKDCGELKPKPEEKWIFVDKKSEETKHRTEWCAEADKYRCMRCGRGSKYMKMPRKCTGPKLFSKRRRHLGGHDLVRRMDRQGEVLIWCRKCSG